MIFLSIINHNHDHLIVANTTLPLIAQSNPVIIKSNTPASDALKNFATRYKITLLNCDYGLGFGENNNYVFQYLVNNNLITDADYFLVINPDVVIESHEFKKLDDAIKTYKSDIFTINLFHDQYYTKPELSVRRFPKLTGPLKGLLSKESRSDAYDKKSITQPLEVDWAAGSFLLFKKSAYEILGGFDTKYFMYFEDVDICRRAKKMEMPLMYLPNIQAIHKGAFNNRKLYSRHFRWYLISYLTYHFLS
ncbi:glycosyltransferase [[Enterobacter] lignolyticus]|uniref:Glycosyltransferase-like protein n=1 Tax=Enterobacter lignolyticus (strain SCF1) TaxID=701347 RepID=E3G109_ENTLS|nr:glycosyltransferase [[Enterobacter] lignolyticus]ADO47923.1 glycosyltransferase-like protein [[Enterobacter] lignolyticus SCF1]